MEIARDYMRQLGYCENSVAKLKIEFRRKCRNFGICRPKQKRIIFNTKKLNESDEFWYGLIAHEVAHIKVAKHNRRFREVLGKLNPEALRNLSRHIYCRTEDNVRAGIQSTFEVQG